jgi:predicted nucleic acid-binding protein
MKTYALDASAVLRYLYAEAGGDRIRRLLRDNQTGDCRVVISAVHWGEVAYILVRREGADAVLPVLSQLISLGIEVLPATAERALKAGFLKASMKIPYVDAFGIDLASDSTDHVLVTADFDVKPAANLINIEFLPVK